MSARSTEQRITAEERSRALETVRAKTAERKEREAEEARQEAAKKNANGIMGGISGALLGGCLGGCLHVAFIAVPPLSGYFTRLTNGPGYTPWLVTGAVIGGAVFGACGFATGNVRPGVLLRAAAVAPIFAAILCVAATILGWALGILFWILGSSATGDLVYAWFIAGRTALGTVLGAVAGYVGLPE